MPEEIKPPEFIEKKIQESKTTSYTQSAEINQEAKKDRFTEKVLILLIVGCVIVGFYLYKYFFAPTKEQDMESAVRIMEEVDTVKKEHDEKRLAVLRDENERERERASSTDSVMFPNAGDEILEGNIILASKDDTVCTPDLEYCITGYGIIDYNLDPEKIRYVASNPIVDVQYVTSTPDFCTPVVRDIGTFTEQLIECNNQLQDCQVQASKQCEDYKWIR